ncbi:DUF2970 domain-containing protein [Marinobacter sp. X15-166B]|uniref:DUF2970 domain-containing protein n=1 Tax=Marinobacter sp. X15-166B TaxID=1897620 RepID=UPI00085BF6BA|nr:DUF2970 domain-containing protein [Marinobacter sp. X15-166B]OEY67679.1 hypothetical protein BG841_15405 [Marinobacter sp. X15-166B]
MPDEQSDNKHPPRPGGFGRVFASILSGALGVQSSKRREEDFASHSPWPYLAAALLFTAGFVLTLVLIVRWVLSG